MLFLLFGANSMKPMIEVSVDTSGLHDHLDILLCFLNSATLQYGFACNEAAKMIIKTEQLTAEYVNGLFVIVFFLLRHAFELSVKALIKEITDKNVYGHNIEKIWKAHIPDYQKIIPEKIDKAFAVLCKYHILKDAQLFRYPTDKDGVRLKDMPYIEGEDIEVILDVAWTIYQLILERIHSKKGLPIPDGYPIYSSI
jgi:hypothetical protein